MNSNERAMNMLMNYTGHNARMIELDEQLQNGHVLTEAECKEVFAACFMSNMDKGN